jgi:subtilisin family serine protease
MSRILNFIFACLSVFASFVAWGAINSWMGGSMPSAADAATIELRAAKSRQAILGETREESKKTGDQSNALYNDPAFLMKWGLQKTDARRAWDVEQGSKDIVVAVIDTGVDASHRNISANLWVNSGESGLMDTAACRKQQKSGSAAIPAGCDKSNNGIDDDGNGFIDDVHGWNFVQNNNDLIDNHGHGTHIAGIIGARGDGMNGVAPNVSLMVLKYFDPKSSGANNLKNTVQAIKYAVRMKARVINYSGGGVEYSAEEFAAVKEAEQAGVLFVAAAGNEKSNSDEKGKHYYPADYGLANIISVTAVNKDQNVLASSNYGVRTVDLAAPGENIYSTLPNGAYGLMTGTSQATAFVTGVAALVMAHQRDLSYGDVKKYILRTGDEYPTLLSKTGTAKLLNSYKALTSFDMGVGVSGVVAANAGAVSARSFSTEHDIKDPRLNTGALSASRDQGDEPAESIAMFGKDLLKAVRVPGAADPFGSQAIEQKR